MKTLRVKFVFLFTSLVLSSLTWAQAVPTTTPSTTPSAAPEMADAEVRKIDREANKVTLKHGPIKNLDMPAMTMVFQVRDPALFDKIAVGDKIRILVEQQRGAYVLTGLEKKAP